MIRELWDGHIGSRRALSVALSAIAFGLCTVALALAPGFVASGGADPASYAKYGPVVGAALGMGVRGYAFHRRPGTRSGLRWALVQGGLMALVLVGLLGAATAMGPIVSANPTFTGDSWLGLMGTGLVLGASSGVLWERAPHRRRSASVLLVAICLIIVGLVGLRSGGTWMLIGTPFLVAGIVCLIAATIQGAGDLVRGAADPAT